MENQEALEVFSKAPIAVAVFKNALPAMAAMLMVLLYNLADTFFIGQTHDALQVAAVSLATPLFLLFMAVGTVFGVGGTSVISRALGNNRHHYAKKVCAFCMWGSVATGIVMSVLMLVFMEQILPILGVSADTWQFTETYLKIVICSGPFVLIANCYSNIIRAEGHSGAAMTGQLLGNFLNIILDPILILGMKWSIAGAAIATVIGNVLGALYYIAFFLRGKSALSISLKEVTLKNGVCSNVLAIGIPAALGAILMSISQIVLNDQMLDYGDMAIAGMGVAMKVVVITGMLCMGLGQGIQPLLGYCVGAGAWERFQKVLKFSLAFALMLGIILTGLCYWFLEPIVSVFLTEPAAFEYAVQFSQILLTTGFLFGVFYVLMNALQAMGAATDALIVNISRQGIIFIPLVFILKALMGITGLIWAQPTADLLSLVIALLLYWKTSQRMMITALSS